MIPAAHTCGARAPPAPARTARSGVSVRCAQPQQQHAAAAQQAACSSSGSGREAAPLVPRRALLAAAAVLPALAGMQLSSSSSAAAAEEAGPQFKLLRDETLAYEFDYPVATPSGQSLSLVVSRRPEKYSSAAPLTADARQRIVCELVDLIDAITISVTVGPPGGILKNVDPSQWTAKLVAEQVLLDRSTGRLTTGQRVSLNSVESTEAVERDGVKYFVYEHVSQGSPTIRNRSQETFRHAFAITAMRPGKEGTPFLYTLNMSCPEELWEAGLADSFKHSVDSFTLFTPGRDYVAPDQNPFLFF